jgi:hypothetical protein
VTAVTAGSTREKNEFAFPVSTLYSSWDEQRHTRDNKSGVKPSRLLVHCSHTVRASEAADISKRIDKSNPGSRVRRASGFVLTGNQEGMTFVGGSIW